MQGQQELIDILKVLAMAGFGGGAMSAFVSLVVEAQWDARIKNTVVMLSCLAISFLGVLVSGIDITNLVVVIPAVILGCKGAYMLFWKPTGIAKELEKIFSHNG